MARDLDRLYRAACERRLTYPEAGATLGGPLPAGYAQLRRRIRLGDGPEVFARAGAYVRAWGAQRGAGFGVHPGSEPVPGATVLIVARLPGLRRPRLVIPCRVVATVSEPRRTGFAYGSLPGHPACGEEAFVVTRDDEDGVWFEVIAFSRPGAWYARLGGPVTRGVQRAAVARYLRAVAAVAAPAGVG